MMCHLVTKGPDGRPQHWFRFAPCNPADCKDCGGEDEAHLECKDPSGEAGDWFPGESLQKCHFRKMVKKNPRGRPLTICWICLKAGRRTTYAGHVMGQLLERAGHSECNADSNSNIFLK